MTYLNYYPLLNFKQLIIYIQFIMLITKENNFYEHNCVGVITVQCNKTLTVTV